MWHHKNAKICIKNAKPNLDSLGFGFSLNGKVVCLQVGPPQSLLAQWWLWKVGTSLSSLFLCLGFFSMDFNGILNLISDSLRFGVFYDSEVACCVGWFPLVLIVSMVVLESHLESRQRFSFYAQVSSRWVSMVILGWVLYFTVSLFACDFDAVDFFRLAFFFSKRWLLNPCYC